MKKAILNIFILFVCCLLLYNGAQGQTEYFRVVDSIPYMPVLTSSLDISIPVTGAFFFSSDNKQPYLYTGISWVSLCSAKVPVENNAEAWFRVIGGIPVLPLQYADSISAIASPGAAFYSVEGGIKVSDGSNWKSMYSYANTDDVTVNGSVQMGTENGISGLFTIPVLDAAPASAEAGAFYFDSAGSNLRVYDGSEWIDIDCSQCQPQVSGVLISGSSPEGYSSGGYTYYDIDGRTESTPAGYRWFLSSDAEGTAPEILSTDKDYVHNYQDENQGKYLNLGVTVYTDTGELTVSDESIVSLLMYNCEPQASGLQASGTGNISTASEGSNIELTAGYVYYDKEGDEEGSSVINWYMADDAEGTNRTLLGTGSTYTYTYAFADFGKYIGFGVTPKAITGYSAGEEVYNDYYRITCPATITVNHVAGSISPEAVDITYPVVETTLGSSDGTTRRCWIAQNLGATAQAASATDATDAAAGWYWQFNRAQGYAYDSSSDTRTPSSEWDGYAYTEDVNWSSSKDPCTLLLGSNWRLPTSTEWYDADGTTYGGGWDDYNDTYASVLKLHAAGNLSGGGGNLEQRGVYGHYWSSSKNNDTGTTTYFGYSMYFGSEHANRYSGELKNNGCSVRCINGN